MFFCSVRMPVVPFPFLISYKLRFLPAHSDAQACRVQYPQRPVFLFFAIFACICDFKACSVFDTTIYYNLIQIASGQNSFTLANVAWGMVHLELYVGTVEPSVWSENLARPSHV
jgi:hypothetical protein